MPPSTRTEVSATSPASQPKALEDLDPYQFTWSATDEPHATRRKQILAVHPEIRKLLGPEPLTFPIAVLLVATQHILANYLARNDCSWWTVVILSYVVCGTISHALQMIGHELAHNLCFKTPIYNQYLSTFCNFGTGLPTGTLFKRYHLEHHQFQGVDGMDTDIPTISEGKFFSSSRAHKLLWLLLNPISYSLRPFLVNQKKFCLYDSVVVAAVVSMDLCYAYFVGLKAAFYIVIGSYMGLSIHPCAGHFVAEHYEFVPGRETYSYYGILNKFNFNVGFHNEHHDFPGIPWTRLPLVKAMAPEFYDGLPRHDSYLMVFWRFVFDPAMGPFRRIKRERACVSNNTTSKLD